jgi:hypothetical protein
VYKKQSRPAFPSGVPVLYSHLARSCWETDVHLRPSFATIRQKLQVRTATYQLLLFVFALPCGSGFSMY